MRKIFVAILMVGSLSAQADISEQVSVRGTVANFDQKKVELHTAKGKILVPRKAFGDSDLRPGREAEARLHVRELLDSNLQRSPAGRPSN